MTTRFQSWLAEFQTAFRLQMPNRVLQALVALSDELQRTPLADRQSLLEAFKESVALLDGLNLGNCQLPSMAASRDLKKACKLLLAADQRKAIAFISEFAEACNFDMVSWLFEHPKLQAQFLGNPEEVIKACLKNCAFGHPHNYDTFDGRRFEFVKAFFVRFQDSEVLQAALQSEEFRQKIQSTKFSETVFADTVPQFPGEFGQQLCEYFPMQLKEALNPLAENSSWYPVSVLDTESRQYFFATFFGAATTTEEDQKRRLANGSLSKPADTREIAQLLDRLGMVNLRTRLPYFTNPILQKIQLLGVLESIDSKAQLDSQILRMTAPPVSRQRL